MKKLFLTLLVLSLLSTAPISAMAVTSLTIKDASCASWIEMRARGEPYQEAWLLGYLTGASVGAGVDILKNVKAETIEFWMDNFCKLNPKKRMTDGTSDLIDALLRDGK